MRSDKKGVLYVVLSALCFSIGGLLIKLLPWNAVTINGARCIFSSTTILVWMKMSGKKLVFNRATLFCAAANALMSVTFVMATKLTTAANAIVLQFTMPVFLILYGVIFFRQKPTATELISSAAVIAGIVCFFLDSLQAGNMAGNLLAVFSGAAYAVVFLTKKIPGADFDSAAVIGHWISILVAIPFALRETTCSIGNIGIVALLGTVQMGFAYIFLSKGLGRVTPVTAAITSMIEPVLNPLLAAIAYPEPFTPLSIIGAVIVIGSIGVYNILNAKKA